MPLVALAKDTISENASTEIWPNLHCSVFSPPAVARDAPFLVQAVVHVEGDAESAIKMAFEADERAKRRVSFRWVQKCDRTID